MRKVGSYKAWEGNLFQKFQKENFLTFNKLITCLSNLVSQAHANLMSSRYLSLTWQVHWIWIQTYSISLKHVTTLHFETILLRSQFQPFQPGQVNLAGVFCILFQSLFRLVHCEYSSVAVTKVFTNSSSPTVLLSEWDPMGVVERTLGCQVYSGKSENISHSLLDLDACIIFTIHYSQ